MAIPCQYHPGMTQLELELIPNNSWLADINLPVRVNIAACKSRGDPVGPFLERSGGPGPGPLGPSARHRRARAPGPAL